MGEDNINIDLYEGDVVRDVAEKFLTERGIPMDNLDTLVNLLSAPTPTKEQETPTPTQEQETPTSTQDETPKEEEKNLRSSPSAAKEPVKKTTPPVNVGNDASAFYKKYVGMNGVTCREDGVCYRLRKTYDVYDKATGNACNYYYESWHPDNYPNGKPLTHITMNRGFWRSDKYFERSDAKWDGRHDFLVEIAPLMKVGEQFEVVVPKSAYAADAYMTKNLGEASEVFLRVHKSTCDRKAWEKYRYSSTGRHPLSHERAYLGGRHEEL